jgi:hypothetical protein
VNESLNQQSTIDYILTSTSTSRPSRSYEVIEPDNNFSDHLPIFGTFLIIPCNYDQFEYLELSIKHNIVAPTQLQWDHADLLSFYEFTRCNLLLAFYQNCHPSRLPADSLSRSRPPVYAL